MKKLIQFEYYKLFQKKVLWYFLLLCAAVNVLLLYYQIHTSAKTVYNLVELSEMYRRQDISSLDFASLEEELTTMSQSFFDEGMGEQQLKEFLMLGTLSQQAASLETYDTYLENIEIQAEQRLESSLFAQPGSFSYRNLQEIPKAYSHLHDVYIVKDFDGGVLLFAQNRFLDVVLLVIAFLIIIQIFVSERENGTWPLIKSMKLGHAELLSAKFITAFSTITGIILAFYVLNFLFIGQSVGFGNTERAIQSVDGYFTSVFPISVGQYMVLLVFMKIVGTLALSSFFAMLCLIVRSSVLTTMVCVGIHAAEFALWYGIYENSYLSSLKFLNLTTLILPDTIISDYCNMNFFSYPVSNLVGFLIMLVLCLAVGLLLSYFLYHNETTLTLKRNWQLRRPHHSKPKSAKTRRRHGRGLWYFEWYKQMVTGKGLLILAVFLCVQILMLFDSSYFITSDEFYYRTYSIQLDGTLSEDKERYLAEEERDFKEREAERLEILIRYGNGEIDGMRKDFLLNQVPYNTAKYNALQQVTYEYDLLKDLHETKGLDVNYTYRTPWKHLLGDDALKAYALRLEVAFLVMLLLLSSCGAIEKGAFMDKLITVSVTGKKGILSRKLTLYFILATLVMLCSFLPEPLKIAHTYGLYGFSAPIASYFLENILPFEITLGGFLVMIHLIFYFILLFMTTIMFFLSEKIGNRIAVLLIGTMLFLMPTLVFILV